MMKVFNLLIAACVFILCISITKAQPDIIYYNGSVITMNPVTNVQEAISITGDRITQVGSNTQVLSSAGTQTIHVDLNGRTILPGFVDPHMHLFELAALSSEPLEPIQQQVFENGITSVGEAYVDEFVYNKFQEFEGSGNMQINLDMYLVFNTNCNDSIGEWFLNYPPEFDLDQKLRVNGVKIFTDGGTCGTQPAITWEYPSGGYGDLFLTKEQLTNMISVAHSNGYPLLLHALGDSAVNQSLDIYESILNGSANSLRHRLDHNLFVDPINMGRYGEIGILPVNFGAFLTCDEVNNMGYTNAFGSEHLTWLENFRLMHDANPGLPIAWKSDAPYWIFSTIQNLYSLVTKKEIDVDGVTVCEPPAWIVDHAITVEEALYMMITHGAYMLHRDEYIGTLEAGKYADLVFLSKNPLTIDPDMLKDINIDGTMSKGKNVYCSNGNDVLCVSDFVSIEEHTQFFDVEIINLLNDQLTIRITTERTMQLQLNVYNNAGQSIIHERLSIGLGDQLITKDLSALPTGMYFLEFQTKEGSFSQKILLTN